MKKLNDKEVCFFYHTYKLPASFFKVWMTTIRAISWETACVHTSMLNWQSNNCFKNSVAPLLLAGFEQPIRFMLLTFLEQFTRLPSGYDTATCPVQLWEHHYHQLEDHAIHYTLLLIPWLGGRCSQKHAPLCMPVWICHTDKITLYYLKGVADDGFVVIRSGSPSPLLSRDLIGTAFLTLITSFFISATVVSKFVRRQWEQ